MPRQRDVFVRKVLLGARGLEPADIFCLQDFPRSGYFDMTFKNVERCLKIFQAFKEKGKEAPLSLLNAEPLSALPQEKERTLTVHMFNPHVPVADVLMFLKRCVDGVEHRHRGHARDLDQQEEHRGEAEGGR
ncbi:zinc finger CCHC domain-containing protein 3-like [Heptranchias perlo]|uniref:zinc finger CCHC domain-containing protein 3-like n=1 Tax=Heptranchias perlo TaxID=212740 RepID=UPI0035596EF9